MNPVVEAAFELQEFLQERGWRFCVIGGLAVLRWGRLRATEDVDVTLFAGMGTEAEFIDPLLARYRARIPDAREFAFNSRVLLIEAKSGVPIDIALAAFPFEEQVIERASPFEITSGRTLVTASLEDVLVLKAFAGRLHDWDDVEGIIARRAPSIDWTRVDDLLRPLCEIGESGEPLVRLAELRKRHQR